MSECSDADSSVAIRALDDVGPCLGPSFSAMGKASSASVSGRLGRRDLSFRVSSLRKCLVTDPFTLTSVQIFCSRKLIYVSCFEISVF